MTGYTIYLNGTKCVDLLAGATPTKDKKITCQVLLEPLDTPPSMLRVRPASLVLTVRSVAQYESADSAPVQLSKEMSDMLLGDSGDFLGSRDFTGSQMTNGVHHDNGREHDYAFLINLPTICSAINSQLIVGEYVLRGLG